MNLSNEAPARADLTRVVPTYNLRALLQMMLMWGRDEGAQERYRSYFNPRWEE